MRQMVSGQRRAGWRGPVVALVGLLAAPVGAQAPDSTASPARPDSVSSPAAGRAPMALPSPPAGDAVAPVPALTPAVSLDLLMGQAPVSAASAFVYALGTPGRAAGVALDGLDPTRTRLRLDGRAADDLLTGAPRPDLLPAEALGPTTLAHGALEAMLRTFRLARPVTELRYLAGGAGLQAASGTHAQTRRWPALLGPEGRLTASLHVATRNADGLVAGGALAHSHVVGRVLATRAGLALDAGAAYADQRVGARRGVVDGQPRDASATRATRRAEAWATARVPGLGAPVTLGVSAVRQSLTYSRTPGDTLRAHTHRLAAHAEQPLGRRTLRAEAQWDADPRGGTDPLGDPGARIVGRAEVRDTLAVGPVRAAIALGGVLAGRDAWPVASVRASGGAVSGGVRFDGAVPGRIEASGLAGAVTPLADAGRERLLLAEAGARRRLGAIDVSVRAVAHRRWNAALLVARGDTAFAYETAPSALDRALVALGAAWRDRARRGVYARADATAGGAFRADASPLHRREADALPALYGALTVGTRAVSVGGVVDLDLRATARGWSGFRSRAAEPATGLLALPEAGTPLGAGVPPRAVLDAWATASFGSRAVVRLGVENALGAAVDAALVAGEPLDGPALRFGVFWALLD